MTQQPWTNPARALKKFLASDPHAARRIAAAVGRTRQTVYAWASGQTIPAANVRAAIEQVTGIPAWHWLSEAERASLSRDA